VQVVEIGVEVLRLGLRCHPINPRGAGLARVAIRLPPQGLVDQVGQRPEPALGIAGCLLCKLLELRWDGGGSQRISRLSVPQNVMPGVACPPVGPLGLSSPRSSVLCAAKTAILPFSDACACRSAFRYLACFLHSWFP
jgi:hypothetical protein